MIEPAQRTPLDIAMRLGDSLGIQLFIKRDDQFRKYYGGNKARKIDNILVEAKAQGCNAIVTAGSPESNHARVCSLAAAQLGWKCTIILHPQDPSARLPNDGNLLLMRLAGAELKIVQHADVGPAMAHEMERLQKSGLRPYYIRGGGHGLPGSKAYYLATHELLQQADAMGLPAPNFIVLASGTGSTHAGVHVGAGKLLRKCTVVGISISRVKSRGLPIVEQSVAELRAHLALTSPERNAVVFRDEFIGAGYGETLPGVAVDIRRALQLEGLGLDPIYTGKAFHGLSAMVGAGEIARGSNVVFWHTGGLINLVSSKELAAW